jgi:hypothetical protein
MKKDLESLVNTFVRAVLHAPKYLSLAFIRGELGVTTIASHHDELALRLFGRLCTTDANRLTARIFRRRRRHVNADGGRYSWLASIRGILDKYGLSEHWRTRNVGDLNEWAAKCRQRINNFEIDRWHEDTRARTSLQLYCSLKERLQPELWLSQHRTPYTEQTQNRWLKLLLRGGVLPLQHWIARIDRKKRGTGNALADARIRIKARVRTARCAMHPLKTLSISCCNAPATTTCDRTCSTVWCGVCMLQLLTGWPGSLAGAGLSPSRGWRGTA